MYKRILISLTIFLCHTFVMAQEFVLTGKVTDAQENVIELASVACVKQGKFTMTNINTLTEEVTARSLQPTR